MFRRLSKTFHKKKDLNKGTVNGNANGSTNKADHDGVAVTNGHSTDGSPDHDNSAEAPATREDVQSTFQQYAQLIHASQRPLPTQSGDGAYLEKEPSTGLWADVKALGLKDIQTIKHIMEDKASGKPQDDKKMHMEEIMQVRKTTVDQW